MPNGDDNLLIKNCFLCQPDKDLIVWENEYLVAMVGLGPLTQKYFVVGTKDHIRSFSDAKAEENILLSLAKVRNILSGSDQHMLMTENGRVPVCRTDGTNHEEHCFHAHVLLFDSPDIGSIASSYFGEKRTFQSLHAAYGYSVALEPYHLVSSSPDDYTVFSQPLNVPRQLFRSLVAHLVGEEGSEDWQQHPQTLRAKKMAEKTRRRLGESDA
ncbi:hypothetical protein [uncultured Roseovarius sp.]|uniref:hypothetical protein n=1 Tax=uncultured Roseovarius sp. TaxID=293344 RepID=UPI002611AA96|nr:hypothetical protein [uncultured Roseovarius sp.]